MVAKGRRIMIANRLAIGVPACTAGGLGMWLALCLLDDAFHLPPGLYAWPSLSGRPSAWHGCSGRMSSCRSSSRSPSHKRR